MKIVVKRRNKRKRFRNFCICSVIIAVWLFGWYLMDEIKYPKGIGGGVNIPACWLEEEIEINKDYNLDKKEMSPIPKRLSQYFIEVQEKVPQNSIFSAPYRTDGPQIFGIGDQYVFLQFVFYDADTNQQITEQEVAEKLFSLFQKTEDKFVYAKKYSSDGNICLYYDGVMKGGQKAYVFSGFQGTNEPIYSNGKQVERIRLVFQCQAGVEAAKDQTIQGILERGDVFYVPSFG